MYRPTMDEQDLAFTTGDAFACVEDAADTGYHEALNEELILMRGEERTFHDLPEDMEALNESLMNGYEPRLVILEVLR